MRTARGSSLIEVVISILLLAMMTTPIMSVALGGKMASGRAERRLAAAAVIRRLSEHLKAYVTADPLLARGPGVGGDGWSLPGDASDAGALGPGHHELDAAQWAPELQPFKPRVSYDVIARRTMSGLQPDVTFHVAWDEP